MSQKTLTKSQDTQGFVAQFIPTVPNGQGVGQTQRKAAQESLQELALPSNKWENWKYTSLKSIYARDYQTPVVGSLESLEGFSIPGLEADRLVFVNGIFQEALSSTSLNEGILEVHPLKSLTGETAKVFETHYASLIRPEADAFTAINTAYAKQGVFIHVPKNAIAKAPIEIIHLTDTGQKETAVQHRNFFLLDRSSEAKVVESFHQIGGANGLRIGGTEIWVGENAGLEYVKIFQGGDQASSIDITEAKQAKNSRFSIFTTTLNGEIVRNHLRIHLDGEHTETHLNGLNLLDGKQHVDNFTHVDHLKPNCYSNELYKSIVKDNSTSVFSGKIHVYPDAQKTNAFQSNRNIVLDDTANIYTKPQLEIYADDVKCSHGATTGRIEEDALFYLRARGIKEFDAQKLLIYAFAAEVVENISMDAVREHIDRLIDERF
ncbi:MAG: Fe-S cluster assembly protein SufD [Bacteroidota bacterium]